MAATYTSQLYFVKQKMRGTLLVQLNMELDKESCEIEL